MKMLTARYESPEYFLEDAEKGREALGGADGLRHVSKAEVAPGEQVFVEVDFPGLPNRVILRGTVSKVEKGDKPAAYVAVAQEDHGAYEFLLAAARGTPDKGVSRKHDRVPLGIPVDWQVAGSGDLIISSTDDLSTGGVQIRTLSPPPVGTKITLRLALDPRSGETVSIPGEVVWTRQDAEFQGMGVKFLTAAGEKGRRIRELIRRILETGELGAPQTRNDPDRE